MSNEMPTDSFSPEQLAFFERRKSIAELGPGEYVFLLKVSGTGDFLLLDKEFRNGTYALADFYDLSISEEFKSRFPDYNEDNLSISFVRPLKTVSQE